MLVGGVCGWSYLWHIFEKSVPLLIYIVAKRLPGIPNTHLLSVKHYHLTCYSLKGVFLWLQIWLNMVLIKTIEDKTTTVTSSIPDQILINLHSRLLPCCRISASRVGSMGILCTEMNPHCLTLFIPKTPLFLGLPPRFFQSPGFPQTTFLVSPLLALHPFCLPSQAPSSPWVLPSFQLLSTPILVTMKLFWLTVWPAE